MVSSLWSEYVNFSTQDIPVYSSGFSGTSDSKVNVSKYSLISCIEMMSENEYSRPSGRVLAVIPIISPSGSSLSISLNSTVSRISFTMAS